MTKCITEMTAVEINRLALAVAVPAVFKAALEYKALKSREQNPAGQFDNGGRFRLATPCDCCDSIRAPSRAYPYSMMVHGRTAHHIAHLFGIKDSESAIKSYANLMEKYPLLADSRDIALSVVSRAEAMKALARLDKKKPKKSSPAELAEHAE
jgi:hypothetical protein